VDCTSGIERFVWAGDNVLWEMRGPGGNGEPASRLEQVSGEGAAYGIVGYTHAGGVDRPLVAHKTQRGYSGEVVIPHMNWRGVFSRGTNPAGGPTPVPVEWPGFRTTAWHRMGETQESTLNWMGNLLEGQRDAGGLMYMRNRYYDPKTGQFTQTDPIGLAGGLNTYGFADGDPVGNWDPFGTCAWGIGPDAAFGRCSDTDLKQTSSLSQDDNACPCLAWLARAAPVVARAIPVGAAVTVASSRALRASMAARGIAPRAGHAAHHIVAGRYKRAEAARQVLDKFQININHWANGVYLPTSRVGAAATGSTNHRALHTHRYIDEVNELLGGASTREEAIAILQMIATQLQQHAFPY
jgi:RHS repeat-associated protein